ncbi:MAG: hypothetical protein IJ800_02245 [Clostridia bacterium]|nr:hypothetical protein [Clostridia bacterium]
MKKIIKGFLALALSSFFALGAAACSGDVVKEGSKIQKCSITLSYTDDGEVKDRTLGFELYLNFAPATIEHFKYLAENGYFNGSAVSSVSSYLEFGAFELKDGVYTSIDDKYSSLVTAEYAKDKTIGKNGTPRYTDLFNIVGEFEANGFGGNKLTLSSGALVVKRDYSKDANNTYYDTGRGTMAVVFGSGSYFNVASKYAIIGKIVSDDATDDEESSLNFAKTLMSDYSSDDNGNTYYYFGYNSDDEELNRKIENYGRQYMKDDDGVYYRLDGNGKYTIELDAKDDDDLIDAFSDNSVYMQVLPYGAITIKSVTFE